MKDVVEQKPGRRYFERVGAMLASFGTVASIKNPAFGIPGGVVRNNFIASDASFVRLQFVNR